MKTILCVMVLVTAMVLGVLAQAQPAKKIPRVGYMRFIEVPVYDAAFRKGRADRVIR